jgi:hypothetical protein
MRQIIKNFINRWDRLSKTLLIDETKLLEIFQLLMRQIH